MKFYKVKICLKTFYDVYVEYANNSIALKTIEYIVLEFKKERLAKETYVKFKDVLNWPTKKSNI